MSIIRCNKLQFLNKFIKESFRTLSTLIYPNENSDIADVPQYPPISEISEKARREKVFNDWKLQVQNVPTVEEKLIKVNMPRYYGWEAFMLDDKNIPYNSLPFVQHTTRTSLILEEGLPAFYSKNNEQLDIIVNQIKSQIQDVLQLELHSVKLRKLNDFLTDGEKENLLTGVIVESINRIILNTLSDKYPHLLKSEVDIEPRHEGFWFAGGFKPSERLKKTRENDRYQKEFANKPIDYPMQYRGVPALTLRSELPLKPIVSLEESFNTDLSVPFFHYNPKVIGYNREFFHGANIPGFWPSDNYKFGLLMYNKRGYLTDRKLNFVRFDEEDNLNALHSQAILSSFAWLHSQACYQGFSTYNELTYPLVTQNIITNGQYWSFYVYQLNTTLIHDKNVEINPRRNICWAMKPQQLFGSIDLNTSKIIDFNDNVLLNLIRLYTNEPCERDNMTPYLGEDQIVANIADDDKRIWLEKHFKHLMSHRPRHRLMYEIYNWERIYKIDNKTRQLEPRRRPFELKDNNPLLTRRLDDHHPSYVPKKLRPEGTKRKNQNKWEKTYYP